MFSWTAIAATGERFDDLAPYVPSVNDSGSVAFQAAPRLADGSQVILRADPVG